MQYQQPAHARTHGSELLPQEETGYLGVDFKEIENKIRKENMSVMKNVKTSDFGNKDSKLFRISTNFNSLWNKNVRSGSSRKAKTPCGNPTWKSTNRKLNGSRFGRKRKGLNGASKNQSITFTESGTNFITTTRSNLITPCKNQPSIRPLRKISDFNKTTTTTPFSISQIPSKEANLKGTKWKKTRTFLAQVLKKDKDRAVGRKGRERRDVEALAGRRGVEEGGLLVGGILDRGETSGEVKSSAYHQDLSEKVDLMCELIHKNKSGQKLISWCKIKDKQQYFKSMPRPKSVLPKKGLDMYKDLKKMRDYARMRQERCIKDLPTFELYVRRKLKPNLG
ncbi:unnamed protein product [Moneuplotes crassus]|uniref:Uncharacterized protein n=1 Tax=Euplotes crassus TaxID=5936 RepID=A0AAD1U7P5_EUPCR|nr:unnamed protein product [Moneuplotes crassus]